jgi:hypothetical protein
MTLHETKNCHRCSSLVLTPRAPLYHAEGLVNPKVRAKNRLLILDTPDHVDSENCLSGVLHDLKNVKIAEKVRKSVTIFATFYEFLKGPGVIKFCP